MEHSQDQIDIIHHLADAPTFLGRDLTAWGISKHVWMMWIAALITFVIVTVASRQKGEIPRGLRAVVEPVLLFIRDQVVMPSMGKEGLRYTPFLWTLFLFILMCNLLGMVPGGATATANVSVTAALAIVSFLVTHFAGLRQNGWHYIKSLVPPVPWPLYIIMIPVEIIGLVTKPFALTIRLWANMTAGHIVLLVFMGFIFLFKNWIAVGIAVPAVIALSALELFVALLQAYVFTFLTATFMGMALHPEH